MAKILGVKISELTKDQLNKELDLFLSGSDTKFISTPNPEIILKAIKDEEYFYILNSCDLNLADGFGLILAGRLQGKKIPRITGSDLTPILLKKAQEKELKVLIISWNQGLSTATEIKEGVINKYPNLELEILEIEKKNTLTKNETTLINNFSPQLVFVTIGAPDQEKLISHELKNWPSVRLVIGVGGSFDFLIGKIKRAPMIMRRLGLEWLWRVISQPKKRWQRLKRIWQATIVFSLKIIQYNYIRPFFYRSNIAIMVYKKTSEGVKILTLAREDDYNHWQLPQGGTDGQKLELAAKRELEEELGTDKFDIKRVIKNVHRYRFNGPTESRFSGYKGQKQSLAIAEFTGTDDEIKINYWDHCAWRWNKITELLDNIHPCRYQGAQIFLNKFNKYIK